MDNEHAGEVLEVWDWEKIKPTGQGVPRKEAHRLGIPHEGVHLWIARNEKGPEVLFQKRAASKDMFPDCLDITVAGHVPLGITENKIQKEAMEEIGISPLDSDMTDLGWFRYEEVTDKIFHRELQHIYLLLDNRDLSSYSFNDGEVDAIYAVPLDIFEAMMENDVKFSAGGFDGQSGFTKTLSREDFHPLLFAPSMKEYVSILIRALKELTSTGTVTARMPLRRGESGS